MKRNLFLVSLFLVFGLVAMSTTALAQNAFTLSNNQNLDARSEGLTEAVGTITFTTVSTGVMSPGDKFTITYNAPIVSLGTVYISESGTDAGSITVGTLMLTNSNKTLIIPVTGSLAGNSASPGTGLSVAVRVNCAQFYPGGGQVTASVIASYTSGTPLTITNVLPYPLAIVQPEPALSFGFGSDVWDSKYKGMSEVATVLTCLGVKRVGTYDNNFTLNVDESYIAALTSQSYEVDTLDPGAGGVGSPDVTNPTGFTITFSNIPVGVNIVAKDVEPCSTLPVADPLYCAGGTLGISAASAPVTTPPTGTPPVYTVSYTYWVTHEDADMPESVDLVFKMWSDGQIAPAYGASSIWANIMLEPITPASAIPLFNDTWEGPIVSGAVTPYNLDVVNFMNCMTTLLYPYVTDAANFETGLAVSNTTLDPFATDPSLSPWLANGSAWPQSGPCTFYLYGNGGELGIPYVTPSSIMAGSTWAFDLFGAFGVPDISGYVIGVCQFQNAHGYAFVTFNLFGDNGVAANYLADVLPDPQWYHRSPAGDALGETAVAPYWINRRLEKLLNYGWHH